MSRVKLVKSNIPNGSKHLKESDEDECVEYRMGVGGCRPQWLQRFNSIRWFIVILSICSLTQGIVVGGLVAVSIESIEREFGLSSKVSGVILAGQHASQLLIVTHVSFFGEKGNKPKWIGIGSIITGIGAIIFTIPKLVAGPYTPPQYNAMSGYVGCGTNRTTTTGGGTTTTGGGGGETWQCEDKFSGHKLFNVVLLFVGQLIMGAGGTPVPTLGPAYLDENVPPEMSPIYLGIWMTFAMMGPALGFTVGGAFLKVYTDVDLPQHLTMDSSDTRWVGAWWFGFVLMSTLFIISGLLILLYPKEMKGGKEKRKQQIILGHLPSSDDAVRYTFKGYFKECLKLGLNRVFILMVLGATIQSIYGAGLFGFVIKVLILKFGVSPAKASIVIGIALIIAMLGGIMGGSLIMRKVKVELAGKSGAQICAIISFIVMASSFMWVIPGCTNTTLAGVMTPYYNSSGTSSLVSDCNSRCECSEATYVPVCGSDQLTYHSPCFAGCTTVAEGADGIVFTNCSCIPPPPPTTTTTTTTNKIANKIANTSTHLYGGARTGKCDRGCKNFYVFVFLVILVSIIGSLAGIPYKMVILRCVPDNKRSFALGMQKFVMKIFQLPGPVLVGSIVDTDCITWAYDTCGRKKNCLDYDITLMSKKLVMLGSLTAAMGTLSFALGWWFYPDTKMRERSGQTETEDGIQLMT